MRPALSILAGIAILLLAGFAHAALPATAPAAAAAERFTGPQTVLAVEADLSKVDANDAARWACDLLLAIMAKDEKDLARARDEMRGQQQWCTRWITDFRTAVGGGACPIVCVTESEWVLDGAYALYVAVPPAGDADRVEVLLGGGPEVRKRKQNQPRHRFDWHSDVKIWPGGIVGQCVGASREPPAVEQPRRPEFAEALSAGGVIAPGGPAARIALVPDDPTREMVAQSLHAGWEFIKPMKWLAIRYDASPLPLKMPAKLTITYRAQDPDAARAVVVAWTLAIDAFYTGGAGLERAEVQEIVRRLTPTIEGDRAVLSIAADEIPRLIAAGRPAIRKAWRLPPPPPPSTRSAWRDAAGAPPDGRVEVGYD